MTQGPVQGPTGARRIVWASHFFPYPPKGGSLQRSFHLLMRLAERHEVHFVGLHRPDRIRSETIDEGLAVLGGRCRSVRSVAGVGGTRGRRVLAALGCAARGLPMSMGGLRDAHFLKALRERLPHADVVHCDTFELAHLVARMPESSGCAVVAHFHNIESELAFRASRTLAGPRRLAWRLEAPLLARLERSVVRTADLCVAVSARDARFLESIGAAQLHEAQNGVDLEYFQYRERPRAGNGQDPTLVWIGGLDWFPNRDAVDYLLRSIWPSVLRSVPGARLVIVGRDRQDVTPREEPSRRISWTGFVDDARPYFHSADVFVVPIRVGGGSRLKILDALASGAPVVSTSLGAEGLDLTPDVHYVTGDDAESFAAGVTRVLAEPERARRMSRLGRERVEHNHGWDKIADELSARYVRLGASR